MYIARINKNNKEQSVHSHCLSVSELARVNCGIEKLKNAVCLAGKLHDAGKNTNDFDIYLRKSHQNRLSVQRGSVTHSTTGAILLSEFYDKNKDSNKKTVELIRHSIISHHGIQDCVNKKGNITYKMREANDTSYEAAKKEVLKYFPMDEISVHIENAVKDIESLANEIDEFCTSENKSGTSDFYLGMCERMILSSLIYADHTDSECFDEEKELPQIKPKEYYQTAWRGYLASLEKHLSDIDTPSAVNIYRKEISNACHKAGKEESGIYRLVVPTGAGKTFSSLRYALTHSLEYGKKRIIYIAPFMSILEQNAKTIRDVLGENSNVLEHHSDVVIENEDEMNEYKSLTQNWDADIILTTTVQFLNTLFSSKGSAVKRMNALSDAVIIIDEVQAIPIKCIYLFNLAMNFLNRFASTSVVLCSATQPPLDKMSENKIYSIKDMIPDSGQYFSKFKRTEIVDCTGKTMNLSMLSDFVMKKTESCNSMLVVLNTKAAVFNFSKQMEKIVSEDTQLYHLSTHMCPNHRIKTINEIKEKLKQSKRVICISTQLVEAGVDLSFESVIRSMAGMDSVIQAGGRCNRNAERESGNVYIVKIDSSDEDVSRLEQIKKSQDVLDRLLRSFKNNPSGFGDDLLSETVMECYYKAFYSKIDENYRAYRVKDTDTTILDMLSANERFCNQDYNEYKADMTLKQAFKSAGDAFEVIENIGNEDIIVYYDTNAELIEKVKDPYIESSERRKILSKLQRSTVSVSRNLYRELYEKGHITITGDVKILHEDIYDIKYGVVCKDIEMSFLNY